MSKISILASISGFPKVYKALDEANLRLLSVDGQLYDPGMAITPLNLDDFDADDQLYILQPSSR